MAAKQRRKQRSAEQRKIDERIAALKAEQEAISEVPIADVVSEPEPIAPLPPEPEPIPEESRDIEAAPEGWYESNLAEEQLSAAYNHIGALSTNLNQMIDAANFLYNKVRRKQSLLPEELQELQRRVKTGRELLGIKLNE